MRDPEETLEAALRTIVEASRNVATRQPFLLIRSAMSYDYLVHHEGVPSDAFSLYPADVQEMAQRGWIALSRLGGSIEQFDLTSAGARAYEQIQRRARKPAQRMERLVRALVDDSTLERRYPDAYRSWRLAEEALWIAETSSALTEIGHHCREAMQHFATGLVVEQKPDDAPGDVQLIVRRLVAVLRTLEHRISETELAHLKALVATWDTLRGLVMRQEHGAQKEGGGLLWEDGRRVVLHTLFVMVEIEHAIRRTSRLEADRG